MKGKGREEERENVGEFLKLLSKHSSSENIIVVEEEERKNGMKSVKSKEELQWKIMKEELKNRAKSQSGKEFGKRASQNNLNRILSNIQFRSPLKLKSITSK